MFRRAIASILLLLASAVPALADAGCKYIKTGAVLTAGQWNECFAAKQDALGYTPLNVAGGTMTGPLITAAPSTAAIGFRLTPGTAPTTATNGDLWTTSSGLYVRIAGTTIGPITGGTSGSFSATSPLVVTFPSGVVNYEFDFSVANTFTATQTLRTILAGTTNTYDIGTSATVAAFRTIYAGTSFVGPIGTFTTSVAVGGATIGANAIAVTGTALFNSAVTLGSTLTYGGVTLSASVTGTGAMVLATTPTLVTPVLGVATGTSLALSGCTIGTDKFCVTGTSTLTGATVVSSGSLSLSGNISAAAWTTSGVRYKNGAATLTDTSSSGTVAAAYTNVFGGNTIAASSSTTFTNYVSSYFTDPAAGTNVTLTNKWALGADSLRVGTSNQLTVSLAGVLTATSPVFTTPTLGAALFTSLAGPILGPQANSTTAVKITKADLSTAVMTFDTTNARVGINKTPGAFDLDVNGAAQIGSTLTVATGYQVAGAATSANYLRGNGTNFVSSAIQADDMPVCSSSAFGACKVDGTTITATAGVITAVGAAATSIAVGTTTVTSGTTTRVFYDNAGVLGEYTISGTGSVAMTTSPAFTTPAIGAATGASLVLTGTGSAIIAAGRQGSTAPAFQVDASAGSSATGVQITAAAAAGGVTLAAISSGTNEGLNVRAKGSGTVSIGDLTTTVGQGTAGVTSLNINGLTGVGAGARIVGQSGGGAVWYVGSRSSIVGGSADSSLELFAVNDVYIAGTGTTSCSTGLATDSNGKLSCVASTIRLKQNIDVADIDRSFRNVMRLRARDYFYRSAPAVPERGFIAEQVAKIDEAYVGRDADGLPYTVKLYGIVADLVAVVQRQQREIDALRGRR